MAGMDTAGGAPQPGHGGHAGFRGGEVDHKETASTRTVVRDFDWGKASKLPDGRTLREWTLVASEKEIEVAPGVNFVAWAYNGRIPGPTLRAKEGERLRIHSSTAGAHPHTIHFHGIHTAPADGVLGLGAGEMTPGKSTIYEFDALPAGLHLYHCHVRPLAEHIAKGLYGAFIIDPSDERDDADGLRHGHERLRHELRPRRLALRREHDRLRRTPSGRSSSSATSSCGCTSSTSSSTT